jgi:hypothetical protein
MFRHAEWERRYNCAGVDIDAIPFEQRAGQFRPQSWALVVLCSIYYPLYVPCLLSIWKQHKGGNSCYTILLYIGCMNVAILWMIGYLHAILSLEGVVFCSSQVALYVLGKFCLALWIAESTADMVNFSYRFYFEK